LREQGIFLREQGILDDEQGCVPLNPRGERFARRASIARGALASPPLNST
jgi:hypothetical protein